MRINKLLLCSLAGIFISMLCVGSVRCFLIRLPIPKEYEGNAAAAYVLFCALLVAVCVCVSIFQIVVIAAKQSNKSIAISIYLSILLVVALVLIAGSIGPVLCRPPIF